MSQQTTITSHSPNGTPMPTPHSTTPAVNPTPKKQQTNPSNTIGLYAVQCGECFKWRLISDEEEYEEIRSKSTDDPFVCSKRPNISCSAEADIEYNDTRTWVIDKPNIPKTPTGFKRKLVLRRDFSKLDAYYVTPSGKKVRSTTEVAKYLEEKDVKGVSVSEFSFAVPKVAEDTIPKNIERKTTASKAEKKLKESNAPTA